MGEHREINQQPQLKFRYHLKIKTTLKASKHIAIKVELLF